MLFKDIFIHLGLPALVIAGPTILARTTSDDDLVTLCFSADDCFQASAIPDGCVDLPLFGISFETASLSASGIQCSLFVERECAGASGLLSESGVTVELSTLGLSTVASIACHGPSDDLATFCISEGNCFQASAIPSGCVSLPKFNEAFQTASLSAQGFECSVFQDSSCGGNTGLLTNSAGTVQLSTLGLSTVESFSCISDENLVTLCFQNSSAECFQADSSPAKGCINLPIFSESFETASFTTVFGDQCTLFEDSGCTGQSGLINQPGVTTKLSTLGLSTVESLKCNFEGDDDLITFCFSEASCFDETTIPQGCVDFPLFGEDFTTVSLALSGFECTIFQ
ncbi:hypothetical protein C8J56DRAFT_971463 [Mycena floridula]|nr:hypothetical protein C8J56DRAFT_971463 [Mycena floridula]